jgi:hypothetical protein
VLPLFKQSIGGLLYEYKQPMERDFDERKEEMPADDADWMRDLKKGLLSVFKDMPSSESPEYYLMQSLNERTMLSPDMTLKLLEKI